MKNLSKIISSWLLIFTFIFTSIFFTPQTATISEAAGTYYIPSTYKNMTYYAVPKDLSATYVLLKVYHSKTHQKPRASSIKALKSSNPSVARPYLDKNGEIRVYFFKKAGKASISFKIGKQTLKSNITIKEYSNPLKTFKIGKKDFTSKFKASTEYNYFHVSNLNNQNVMIKAAKGWKISSLDIHYGPRTYKINSCRKDLFSKLLMFNGSYDYINITMYHTKSKSHITLYWNSIKN